MKYLIFIISLMIASIAWTKTANLECSNSPYTKFNATLDDSTFEKGSGFFDIKKASIRDNYASAELICAGYSLNEIACVGFWFNFPGYIVEVKLKNKAGAYSAIYKTLSDDRPLQNSSWPCTIK